MQTRTMQKRARTRIASAMVSTAGLAAIASFLCAATQAASIEPDDAPLQSALASLATRARDLQTTRRLRAASLNGKHSAWLDAEVTLEPGGFSYRVLDEGGSMRTREKVLRGVLDAERDVVNNWSLWALTPANYTFTLDADQSPDGFRRVRVRPRREDTRLVDGVLTLTAEGQVVSLEGRLAKTPSFWVRSVTVIRRFSTIDGFTLPVAVESLADVRFVGPSAFFMEYEYRAVNGMPVASQNRPESDDPSPRLLALHAALKGPGY
jgi:hypothetical protein